MIDTNNNEKNELDELEKFVSGDLATENHNENDDGKKNMGISIKLSERLQNTLPTAKGTRQNFIRIMVEMYYLLRHSPVWSVILAHLGYDMVEMKLRKELWEHNYNEDFFKQKFQNHNQPIDPQLIIPNITPLKEENLKLKEDALKTKEDLAKVKDDSNLLLKCLKNIIVDLFMKINNYLIIIGLIVLNIGQFMLINLLKLIILMIIITLLIILIYLNMIILIIIII